MPPDTRSLRPDVTALGELVIDLVPARAGAQAGLFAAKPGGAPGNLAAGIARLGLRAAMVSKVGPGRLGDLILRTLADTGVDTRGVARAATEPTALAIVSVDENGERDFALYRDGCADASLRADEIPLDLIRASRVLHVGSLTLGAPVSAGAQRAAVAAARQAGALVSTDVNFRPALWRDPAAMLATGREAIAGADIVKVSEGELCLLTGSADLLAGVGTLWHPGMKLVAVTRGREGADLFTGELHCRVAGFEVEVVDTVGCGDAFMAALLCGLIGNGFAALDEEALVAIGRFACAAGAVVAGVAGAMDAMPRRDDIAPLLATAGGAASAQRRAPATAARGAA